MNLILLVLAICFLFFLYVLYYLARDDFVIVRRDVPTEKIFNMAFLTAVVTLFFSRIFFILFHPKLEYFNPLGFLAIPYLPGLSLIGGIVGGAIFIYAYSKMEKMPIGKMFDLFSISFAAVLPLGYIGVFILLLGKTGIFFNLIFIFSVLIYLFLVKFIQPFSAKGEIKDGSLGLIFLSVFCSVYFLIKLFLDINTFSFLDPENILLFITMFSCLILLLNQEIVNKFLSKK